MDELTCTLCGLLYDETERPPLMIPDCGHTFCRGCINNQLQQLQGKSFLCPEDNMVCLHRTHISQFPVNCVLLKILQRQRKPRTQASPYHTNVQIKELKDSIIFSRQATKTEEDPIKVQVHNYCTLQQDTNLVDDQPVDLCPEHFQKLDIVCLTDRARICTKCALFGQHKQHDVSLRFNSKFRSVDDVVKEVTLKAENIMHIYQQIQNKQSDLHEQRWYEAMSEKFKSALRDSQCAVKEKFNDIHQMLVIKEQKFHEQLGQIISTLESQSRRQISEIINQCSSSVELWKITAKDRLLYFSQTTEIGEIPLELYNTDFSCLEKGQKILEEIEKTLQNVDQKGQNIKIKKLRVDFRKKELEKTIDSYFTLTLQMNNSGSLSAENRASPKQSSNNLLNESLIQQQQSQPGDQSVRLQRGESLSKIFQGDIFSSFCCDDPMLLKDVSLADWSELQPEMDCTTETTILQRPMVDRNQQATPQKTQIDLRKNTTSFKLVEKVVVEKRNIENSQKHSFEGGQIIFQNSPANKNVRSEENKLLQQVTSIRSGVSPTPKLPIDKKKKSFKINEKFDQLWQALKNDNIETADFSNAELQDEGTFQICELIKSSRRLKTLKLVRNRITDDGACKLLDAFLSNPHQQFFSLHMQSNLITEKTLDYYMLLIRNNPNQGSLPKSLYLNQNLINCTKTKKKLDDVRKLGLTVTV